MYPLYVIWAIKKLSAFMPYLILLYVLDTVLYKETMNNFILIYLFVSAMPVQSNWEKLHS